jgi:hypothetical protein
MVVTLRHEFRRPIVAVLAFWCLAAALASWWVESFWLSAFAAGGIVGSVGLLLWVIWPRRGDLERLVLDRVRKTLYWAHRGGEPEELPFKALRAVAIEQAEHPRYAQLWAVDTSGRWVSMGQGTRPEMEHFAREMADVIDVPLWFRERSPNAGGHPLSRVAPPLG